MGAGLGPGVGAGLGFTDRGQPWPLRALLAAYPDADLLPILTTDHGAPLWMGRTIRLANTAQRHALAARDVPVGT